MTSCRPALANSTGGTGYNDQGSVPDPVRLWHEAVHTPGRYDVDVHTDVLSADECADVIARHLNEST